VRDIVEVAGIEDPERIDVVVAPDWKYDALDRDRQRRRQPHLGADGEPHIREQGDDAASYGQDLQANREALQETLSGDDEYDALRAASWLIEREFDAPVRVERAADADESVVRKAEPGRPGRSTSSSSDPRSF